jgi:hypothetical protein
LEDRSIVRYFRSQVTCFEHGVVKSNILAAVARALRLAHQVQVVVAEA